ncbi:MAG: glycosyltransferase family 2 protein [Marinilabiliaceae bacterium]|nr:glycosyltransferase family 2 protein [Marinilabiliaceae bacterium]
MKATVISTVYNQAPFLPQMIESVLCQQTDFEFEFIIANDCSSDDSAEIISRYAQNNRCIKFVDNPNNLGFIRNYAQCLEQAAGKYIATLGGDDFWIDSKKLQMQVDFLEKNPDYGMVHTQFDELFMYKKFMQPQYQKNAQKTDPILQGDIFYRLVVNNTINAISVCYAKSIIQKSGLIQKFKKQEFMIEDLPLWLQISRTHKVGYIDKSTVCYRRNKDSASHFGDIEKYKEYMDYVKSISLSFLSREEIESPSLKDAFLQTECLSYTYFYFKKGDLKSFKKYYFKLERKTLDRIVMLWVLSLNMSFLFNGRC